MASYNDSTIGKMLTVRGPRNHFGLKVSEKYVFIAGGIGVTPILPMVRSLGIDADWQVFYTGRSTATMAFAEELIAVNPERVHLLPRDAGERLDIEELAQTITPSTAVYCCGPSRLLEAVDEALTRLAPDTGSPVQRRLTRAIPVISAIVMTLAGIVVTIQGLGQFGYLPIA